MMPPEFLLEMGKITKSECDARRRSINRWLDKQSFHVGTVDRVFEEVDKCDPMDEGIHIRRGTATISISRLHHKGRYSVSLFHTDCDDSSESFGIDREGVLAFVVDDVPLGDILRGGVSVYKSA